MTFNSSIILFASIIILTDNNFFDRLSARSIYQVTWFFILITLFTVIIVFFNVKFLPTIVYQNAWIARPLELIPLFIFIINGTIILPVFYKKNQSIFSSLSKMVRYTYRGFQSIKTPPRSKIIVSIEFFISY